MKSSKTSPPVVLITGASRGIGRAIAERLGREGHRLAIGARSVEALREIAASLREVNPEVLALPLDVTREESVEAFFREAAARFGRIDVLVNNAGVEGMASVEDADLEESRRILDVDFFGVLLCSKHAVRAMRSRGGHIITIGSEASFRGLPTKGVYSAAKFAVRGLTDALRMEVERYRIKVSLLNPGYVETGLHAHARALLERRGYAPPRARSTPEDLAAEVLGLMRRPRRSRAPSLRGRIQILLAELAPWWVDWRTRRVLRRNRYEFY